MATSWWRRMFGKKTVPPAITATAGDRGAAPQTLGSEEEVFLAQLVQDLGDGKRRDEVDGADVRLRVDGLWAAGHERLPIEWMEKLLGVPGVTAPGTRAALVERYDQRGELDTALPHLEQLV